MRMKTILNVNEHHHTSFECAEASFYKFCTLKNLREQTLTYYKEDITYFKSHIAITNIDELTQEIYDDFIYGEIEKGKKTTSLNTRIRGLRVFFNFCVEREYMEPINAKLLKTDKEIKEPYTDAELKKLLRRPTSNKWVEWRSWAIVNYLVATGNRIGTVADTKISDINFDEDTILMRTVKNRKQQILPLSPALKTVLLEYLDTWAWDATDFLFPTFEKKKLQKRTLQGTIAKYNVSRGVSKTSCHLFRHTFAKNFILAGGGLVQLQALLGHSTMDMSRHYVEIYGLDLRRDFEKLNPLDNFMKAQ